MKEIWEEVKNWKYDILDGSNSVIHFCESIWNKADVVNGDGEGENEKGDHE